MNDEVRNHNDDVLRRLDQIEVEQRYARDDMTDIGKALSSLDATVHVIATQLKTVTDRPPQWHNVIAAVSVMVTIGVLSLTPVAWLAVNNYAMNQEDAAQDLDRGIRVGMVLEANERQDERLDDLRDHFLRLEARVNTPEGRRGFDE